MTRDTSPRIRVAIACGGTGGHLFPGLAVAGEFDRRGCAVTLLVSPKEVDQQAVQSVTGPEILTLPAVGLSRGRLLAFARGFVRSYRAAARAFRARPPHAVLAMGGFTSAPPVLAARRLGARGYLHESNTIPGRANRWLARVVDAAFVGFPSAAARLRNPAVTVTGTPVRGEFQPRDPASCRAELGLDPARPVVLVMGGSQGARGVNDLILAALPQLTRLAPDWQWFHLSGNEDLDRVRRACEQAGARAVVHPFFSRMECALGAATVAVSRAGASSLAELAAMRVPSVLVPYPAATDNHQFHNADAFVRSGAARMLEQRAASPADLVRCLGGLMQSPAEREQLAAALAAWHQPRAAEAIALAILAGLEGAPGREHCRSPGAASAAPPPGPALAAAAGPAGSDGRLA